MPGKIHFGVYELDLDAMELRKHGALIRLQDQPLQVLAALVQRPGEIVTRDQLQERIWGKDTFVDFDQSLNKAVNRLREALNDDPGRPQYVETVPRRGYRFVAPITEDLRRGAHCPEAASQGSLGSAGNSSPRRPSRNVIIATLSTASMLVVLGSWAVWRWQGSARSTLQEPEHITSAGFAPALSRDGRLLAYGSTGGGAGPQLWVQQTAGGDATLLTRDSGFDGSPDFSPDGTRIAFYSNRDGGGIYITPTLPGEPRLVLKAPYAVRPRFSPDGENILYWDWKDETAMVVPVNGGQPLPLPLNQNFRVYSPPFWAPNGEEILFYGVRNDGENKPGQWWIAARAGGEPKPAHLPEVERNYWPGNALREWIRTPGGREWIIYSTATLDSWKLWRVSISPREAIDQNPELLASGTGRLGPGGAASPDGRLAYNIWRIDNSVYQIPTSERGEKTGPTVELALPGGSMHRSPSVSRDGKWMAYDNSDVSKPNTILLRDLRTGTDHVLDDIGRQPLANGETSISPDGSQVVFERDCKEARWMRDNDVPETPAPCSFAVAAAGGVPEQICEQCTPRGFSSDGSVVLFQKYDEADATKDRITSFDLRTKTEREFLSDPEKPVFHAFFSWDDHWVVFKKLLTFDPAAATAQILIAPVRHGLTVNRSEWIAITDGHYSDDKPQFSPDGNTIYFTSNRDGYLCIWAQHLDPATKHPVGAPFAYEHFHNAVGRATVLSAQWLADLSVSRDKIVINLPRLQSDIWMMQMK
jgi:eukaryotic-like serine/threonine-protein kinase